MMIRPFTLAFAAVIAVAGCRPAPAPDCELRDLAIDAALGDPAAQYDLAVQFYTGKRIRQDYAKAAVLWRRLADGGNSKARNNLGFLTYYGYGVRADPAAAVRMWTEAAAQGEIEANYHLGVAAREGKGTPRSTGEAFARLRAVELMGVGSRDPVVRSIVRNARSELLKLGSLPRDERGQAEAQAREYAAVGRRSGSSR